MISKAEFDRRFEDYHRRNARKRPHLVAWNPVGEAQLREIEQATGIELPRGLPLVSHVVRLRPILLRRDLLPAARTTAGTARHDVGVEHLAAV
jgi:hypothetical protein